MRKIYSFIIAATAVAAAASCTQELENKVQEQTGETVVFTAVTDGTETKAVLDGTVSKWRGEELIILHDGTNAFTFYGNAGEEPVSSLKFSYTPGEGQPEFTASEVMAVYPSGNYTADLSAKTVGNMVIPDRQSLVEDTYPSTAAVAMAYSTDKETLKFKNATTLLKFKVAGDDVSYGSFVAKAGSGSISGTFDAAYNDGKPVLTATEGKLWVDFQKDDGFLSKEATYYIAVAPAALKGFTIYFNSQEIRSFNSDYTLERNDIINLGTLTYEAPETASVVYLKPGPWSSDKAWFAAYFFSSTGNKAVKMTDDDGDGIYEAAVPEGDYSKVIFCRMNPKYKEFGWNSETESDHVWNEGNKEYIPSAADDKVCHVVNDWNSYVWQTVEMAAAEWTIAGTFNEWSAAPMTESGDYFVAKNVTAANTGSGFKILQEGNWLGYGEVATGVWTALGGSDNITVTGAEAGTAYDVYVDPSISKFIVVAAGAELPKEEIKTYGIVGDITGWADGEDIPMTAADDKYVAYNVTFTAAGGFKIRANNTWADSDNWGLSSTGSVEVGHYYDVITSGGSGNLTVAPGTYDIWFDLSGKKIYVLTPGASVNSATKGTPIAPSSDTWYLLGEFNGWTQRSVKFVNEAGWFVLRNCEISKSGNAKINAGNWDVQRTGVFGGLNGSFALKSSGNDFYLPAGTYDIWMNSAADKIYFLAPGMTPYSTGNYRLYIKNGKSYNKIYLHAWNPNGNVGYKTNESWPGHQLSLKASVESYGECYYVEIPIGTGVVNYIVNGGSGNEQTKDLTCADLTVLSNGDLYYHWK